ncbi:hypothetical protein OU995_01790 [Roseateles sp. SL47]|uniref:hypothetical protein n=1 Tax=Roseateles sp. SL47 TaxID=2995138 RepID=UPI0022712D2D|nr:hypothetical protein [Roseateles sp. SL47]WAC73506.1 hypothetical protein OU995_01790 [Roseateles sp. SL47]
MAGTLKIVAYGYLAFATLSAFVFCLSLKGRADMNPLYTALILGALGGFHLFLSDAADRKQDWSRSVSVLVAVPLIFGFPIGSIFGFIIIANSLKDWEVDPE